MPAPVYSVRIPDSRKQETDRRRGSVSFSDWVNAALDEKNGKDPATTGEDCSRLRTALAASRAEAGQLRTELAAARRALASIRREDDDADRFTRLAAAIAAATPEFPVTRMGLREATGYSVPYLAKVLRELREAGAVTQPADGENLPAPGADIRKALLDARAANSQAVMDREAARKSGAARPATARTAPAKGKSAATREAGSGARPESSPPVAAEEDQAATVASLREKAERIAPGTVMFQEPGADRRVTHAVPEPVDHTRKAARPRSGICPPHPKNRVHKGFCGLCGRQVHDDERIK